MSDADKYKDTIFLPKTDFPMKAGLPQRGPHGVHVQAEHAAGEESHHHDRGGARNLRVG